MSEKPLWPHQAQGINEVVAHIASGVRRILLTSPTGGGKSRIVAELIAKFQRERDWKAIVYTNRKMLVEQLTDGLRDFGLRVGVRAAGNADNRELPIQVSSIQTEESRVYKRKNYLKWELHPANIVFIDEAHIQNGKVAEKVKQDHYDRGAVIVEVTATPLDMDGLAEKLVVAGTNSQLRECGSLVRAMHYGCEEPDLRHIGRTEVTAADDLSEREQRSLMGSVQRADGKANPKLQKLFGRVVAEFQRINPTNRPSILFAPGVPESRWFAQEFTAHGISAAHIDGDEIWLPTCGDVKAGKESRKELLEMSRDGLVKVICNRFVLREGIDAPWLSHGVFATPFGSLQSYLQSGGRLLRAFPGLTHVTIQDHGGCWHRHGSLNEDRVWGLGDRAKVIAGERADRLREKQEKEPCRCPRCGLVLMSLKCVCGFSIDANAKTRPVIMEDGELVMMPGDVFHARKTDTRPDTQAKWWKEFFRAKNCGHTFRQAIASFWHENGYWPPPGLKGMPKRNKDQWRPVKDLQPGDLL